MDGIKCILLDIEGTVVPISFVKSTLFPYALQALPDVLAHRWEDPLFTCYRDAFPEQHRQSPRHFLAHVEDLTTRDLKLAYHKNLQGFLWQDGYRSGAYSTPLFPDVVPQLRRWKRDGLSLSIYSSGSLFAQKLLFAHVQTEGGSAVAEPGRGGPADNHAEDQANRIDETPGTTAAVDAGHHAADGRLAGSTHAAAIIAAAPGDAGMVREVATATADSAPKPRQPHGTRDWTPWFDAWFDTTNAGRKTEVASYEKIADELKFNPGEILFLSDNVREIDAAHEANLHAILVDRPGNAELALADRRRLQVVESLGEVYVNRGPGTEAVDVPQ